MTDTTETETRQEQIRLRSLLQALEAELHELGTLADRLNGVPAASTRQETGELELF